MRDWKPSEVGNYDLTRAVEEDGGGGSGSGRNNSVEPERRPAVVSLGQGKWPDDFIDASEPPARSRKANTIKPSMFRAT